MSENVIENVQPQNDALEAEKEQVTAQAAGQEATAVAEAAEESFEALMEESLKSMSTDQKVRGIVVGISPSEIQVDIGRGLAGTGNAKEAIIGDGAGVLSLTALVASIGFMLFFTLLNKKLKKNWIEALAMPLSMVLAMVIVVLINSFLPEIAAIEWRY